MATTTTDPCEIEIGRSQRMPKPMASDQSPCHATRRWRHHGRVCRLTKTEGTSRIVVRSRLDRSAATDPIGPLALNRHDERTTDRDPRRALEMPDMTSERPSHTIETRIRRMPDVLRVSKMMVDLRPVHVGIVIGSAGLDTTDPMHLRSIPIERGNCFSPIPWSDPRVLRPEWILITGV